MKDCRCRPSEKAPAVQPLVFSSRELFFVAIVVTITIVKVKVFRETSTMGLPSFCNL